jgi:hypothetical protein
MVTGWTIVNVGLSFALANKYGVNGVITATLVATVLLVFPVAWLFLDSFDVRAWDWIRRAILPQLPGAACQVAVGLVLLHFANQSGSLIVVALLGAVSILASFAGYWLLGLGSAQRGVLRQTVRKTLGTEEDVEQHQRELAATHSTPADFAEETTRG